MKFFIRGIALALALHLAAAASIHNRGSGAHGARGRQPESEDPVDEAERIVEEVSDEGGGHHINLVASKAGNGAEPSTEDVKVAATNAKSAADVAKQAAVVANNVATHSIKITKNAKSALKHALGALHDARVESTGLDKNQKEQLTKAEGKLREATKTADFGKLKKVKGAEDRKRAQMEADLEKKKKKTTELEQMRKEVRGLRQKLKEKGGDAESEKDLKELEEELERLEKANDSDSADAATNDEMKAEIERLRDEIDRMKEAEKGEGSVDYDVPEAKSRRTHELPTKRGKGEEDDKEFMKDVKMQPLDGSAGGESRSTDSVPMKHEATPVQEKGIDIDTQMPYGDLEPFGREDTAQELTESSVRESDEMVDQLERAEVAEEKRAVFRALTRLRGAAITSFDGVARSQTGNIDEYNKVHKWRKTHPLHHLADEESDVTKWAFPDNADLIQVTDANATRA